MHSIKIYESSHLQKNIIGKFSTKSEVKCRKYFSKKLFSSSHFALTSTLLKFTLPRGKKSFVITSAIEKVEGKTLKTFYSMYISNFHLAEKRNYQKNAQFFDQI